MLRAVAAVIAAMLVGQTAAFLGSTSTFLTGTMSAGLRTPGSTSALSRGAKTYRRAKSGAASTVMMPIGVPKVRTRVVVLNRGTKERTAKHSCADLAVLWATASHLKLYGRASTTACRDVQTS